MSTSGGVVFGPVKMVWNSPEEVLCSGTLLGSELERAGDAQFMDV